MEETTFKSSPEQFLSLEVKAVCVAAGVSMERSMDIFLFSLPAKIDVTVHTDVELNPGPTSSSPSPIVDAGVEVRSGCVINKGF